MIRFECRTRRAAVDVRATLTHQCSGRKKDKNGYVTFVRWPTRYTANCSLSDYVDIRTFRRCRNGTFVGSMPPASDKIGLVVCVYIDISFNKMMYEH